MDEFCVIHGRGHHCDASFDILELHDHVGTIVHPWFASYFTALEHHVA